MAIAIVFQLLALPLMFDFRCTPMSSVALANDLVDCMLTHCLAIRKCDGQILRVVELNVRALVEHMVNYECEQNKSKSQLKSKSK